MTKPWLEWARATEKERGRKVSLLCKDFLWQSFPCSPSLLSLSLLPGKKKMRMRKRNKINQRRKLDRIVDRSEFRMIWNIWCVVELEWIADGKNEQGLHRLMQWWLMSWLSNNLFVWVSSKSLLKSLFNNLGHTLILVR